MTYPHQPNDHQTQRRAPKLLTNGLWTARPISWGLEESDEGKPYFRITFELLDGPDHGARTSWKGYLIGGATEITLKTLRGMGWVGDDLEGVNFPQRDVKISLQDNEWNGVRSTRVKFIATGAQEGYTSRLEPMKRKALASSVNGMLRSLDAMNPDWKAKAKAVAEAPSAVPGVAPGRGRADTDPAPAPRGIGPAPAHYDTEDDDHDDIPF